MLTRAAWPGKGSAWLVVLASALAGGCAETSPGDCTDKGRCDPGEDAGVTDASLEPSRDATVDALDAADSSDSTTNAPPDAALDAPHDALSDALLDAPSDAPEDAPSDAPADAPPATCTCVEAPPPGWAGPLALAESTGTPPPALAPCAAPYSASALDGASDPVAAAAQCGCTCGPVSGVACPSPAVDFFSDSACATRCNGAQGGAACVAVSTAGCGGAIYARALAPTPDGGACTPRPSSTVSPGGWTRAARACALVTSAPQSDCAASKVCAPLPASPFSAHLCVAFSGDVACPGASAYSVRHVYFAGVDDTRGCAACTCAAPGGGTCAGSVSVYNTAACTLFTRSFALGPACNVVQIATSGAQVSALTESGSACAPGTPQATGAFTPTSPTTVCCLP